MPLQLRTAINKLRHSDDWESVVSAQESRRIMEWAASAIDRMLEVAYAPRTKTSALNAYNNFPKTGIMHVGDFYDDGNYFKTYLVDKEHPAIKAAIASKDEKHPAGRLAHDADELADFQKSPDRLNEIGEFAMNWQSGRPKNVTDYYTQHRAGHKSMADAIRANGGEGYGSFSGSTRGSALNDMLDAGEIK